ncbi:MAG: NUDIX domain-containing protein [Candidatus Undinarchaeales archaeon]|jgi:ADP-ribose pyrophosphatase YjhB (NUDIX family)|nr:NUDIX domain-containing protein [Candidatus Undinarchaeales archaeon]MDP7493726.1 NUDIX domain-containing protein [Candidatus Undinarchaeales archaeon]
MDSECVELHVHRVVTGDEEPVLDPVDVPPGQRAVASGPPIMVRSEGNADLARDVAAALPAGCELVCLGEPVDGCCPVIPMVLEFRRNAETVDVLVLTKCYGEEPAVLLIRRGRPPYEGMLALPGGFVEYREPPQEAAVRELAEETGLVLYPRDRELAVLSLDELARRSATFGSIEQEVSLEPDGPVISAIYLERVMDGWDDPRFPRGAVRTSLFVLELDGPSERLAARISPGDDASHALVVPISKLANGPVGFAHHLVLIDAVLDERGIRVPWEGENRERLDAVRTGALPIDR